MPTDKFPRISSLPGLVQCPGFAVLRAVGEDGGSVAADTGSVVGRVCELWHRKGEGPTALEEALQQVLTDPKGVPEHPRADMEEVRAHATGYTNDPRNRGMVVPELCEQEVTLTLQPAPEDPTGQPLVIVGHIDQVRRVPNQPGVFKVWDLKNGKPGGLEMLYSYALQLAAYTLALNETLGSNSSGPTRKVFLPGGIVRLRAYAPKKRGEPKVPGEENALYEAPWTIDQCRDMVATAVQHLAWIRTGIIHLQPGVHCQWCPAGGPHLCPEKIRRLPTIPSF